jgi:hypothetical protein
VMSIDSKDDGDDSADHCAARALLAEFKAPPLGHQCTCADGC